MLDTSKCLPKTDQQKGEKRPNKNASKNKPPDAARTVSRLPSLYSQGRYKSISN